VMMGHNKRVLKAYSVLSVSKRKGVNLTVQGQ